MHPVSLSRLSSGAARVRELFARAGGVGGPCVVFIDELDAMGKARGGLHSHDEREQTLNQLLTEMDGFSSGEVDGSQVLVLAATNRAATLDPALTRPGRFDRHVTVGLADAEGRAAILAVHTRRVKLARNVDVRCVVCAARGVRRAGVPRGRAARSPSAPPCTLNSLPISPRLHLAPISLSAPSDQGPRRARGRALGRRARWRDQRRRATLGAPRPEARRRRGPRRGARARARVPRQGASVFDERLHQRLAARRAQLMRVGELAFYLFSTDYCAPLPPCARRVGSD